MSHHLIAASLRDTALVFLVSAVMAVSAAAGNAEGQGGPLRLTLNQAVEMALEQNLDMKVAWEDIEAARERQKEARTGFLPSLSGKYSYRRPSEVPYAVFAGNQFDFADRNQYRLTGTIEQPLFTGFSTLSNYQLAKLGLDVANLQLARTRLDLILQVKVAYFAI